MKQFRVKNTDTGLVEFKSNDLTKVNAWLLESSSLNRYLVDDVKNDCEVYVTDILEAFRDGEHPGDLTFF